MPNLFQSRATAGLAAIGLLLVALQIPLAMVRGLIHDRVVTRDSALAEVTAVWGGGQVVAGPRLVVPLVATAAPSGVATRFATFLPDDLSIEGEVASEALSRGLFTIPTYRAQLRLTGSFAGIDTTVVSQPGWSLDWNRAALVVEVSDPRTVGGSTAVRFGDDELALRPGTLGSPLAGGGFHAPIGGRAPADGFDIALEVTGSSHLRFVPLGRDTSVRIGSDWASPSFGGSWLPTGREIGTSGFTAEWSVPFLGRDYPQQWVEEQAPLQQVAASHFGVDLVDPVDHYRMTERSTKYAPLFLTFTFGLLWLFDVLLGLRVHAIQYGLVGAAMCLFYLLELSLAEHIGFVAAYAVAGGSVAATVGGYTSAVLQSFGRGGVVGGAMGALYAYLLALLTLERYALLAGSLGLFAALAAAMYATRWVDWYRFGRPSEDGAVD